jgi:hypothetical protein
VTSVWAKAAAAVLAHTVGEGKATMTRRDRPRNRSTLAGVVCAVLLSLTACAGNPEQEPENAAAPGIAPFRLVLPFDQYKWNPREQGLYEQARILLLKRCVQSRGTTFTMPERMDSEELPDIYDNSRRYGLAHEAAAARFGYHIPADSDGGRQRREIGKWSKEISAAEETAIYGAPGIPGCYEQADAELAKGTPGADTDWLTARSSESRDETAKNESVVNAKAGWRACMAGLGFTYADPDDALGDRRWDVESPTITETELRTALADVRCKDSSGLVRVWQEVETTWQRQVIDRNADRFPALAATKQTQLSNARQVIENER